MTIGLYASWKQELWMLQLLRLPRGENEQCSVWPEPAGLAEEMKVSGKPSMGHGLEGKRGSCWLA